MENGVFTLLANRLGREMVGEVEAHFRGESLIIDCGGNILASAGGEACAMLADIDPLLALQGSCSPQ